MSQQPSDMSQQPSSEPLQRIDIDNTSVEGQVGQADGDLFQVQGSRNWVFKFAFNLFGKQGSDARQEYRNRQVLLNKVNNYWIKGVLETSLYNRALIALDLEERLDTVDRPWNMVLESPDKPKQTLPVGTKVINLFDQMGAGRTLLILGEPGSGKTITLLELARDLVTCAEQDTNQPVPVVFNLSSWRSESQTIVEWLVHELSTKYQVSKEISKTWVKAQQLLLMLDGLDEVSRERQESCVRALNRFSQEHGQTEIVVCSRIKEYEALSNRLKLQGAICLQPLTLKQINRYLANLGPELAVLNIALQSDTTLQELARTPLMLSVMTLAYQGMTNEDLPRIDLIEEYREHLFDAYIQRMFSRRGANRWYSREQARCWLTWLAQQMSQQSQTVFLIERMQSSLLQTNLQRWIYATGAGLTDGLRLGLIVGLAFGLMLGLIGVISSGQVDKLISYLAGGLGFGLILGSFVGLIFVPILTWKLISGKPNFLSENIELVETLRWSWTNARKSLVSGLISSLIIGLVAGLISGLISQQPLAGLIVVLVFALIVGPVAGLIIGLIGGLRGPAIEKRTIPNQGIWKSAVNAGIFSLTGGLGLMLAIKLTGHPIWWPILGLFFGLARGGEACIKHFALRAILYCNGYIPWNYARFLDHATESIFLQKVGGGYIFIHRLLREHFATLQSEQVKS